MRESERGEGTARRGLEHAVGVFWSFRKIKSLWRIKAQKAGREVLTALRPETLETDLGLAY